MAMKNTLATDDSYRTEIIEAPRLCVTAAAAAFASFADVGSGP